MELHETHRLRAAYCLHRSAETFRGRAKDYQTAVAAGQRVVTLSASMIDRKNHIMVVVDLT